MGVIMPWVAQDYTPQLTRDMGGRKDLENVSVHLSKRLWPGALEDTPKAGLILGVVVF